MMPRRLLLAIAAGMGLLLAAIWLWTGSGPGPESPARARTEDSGPPSAIANAEIPNGVTTSSFRGAPLPAVAGSELRILVLDGATREPQPGAEVVAVDPDILAKRVADEQERRKRTLDSSERAAIRRTIATFTATDSAGAARVRMSGDWLVVEATAAGGLWGRRVLTKPPAAPVEILLSKDETLRVRVSTAALEPASEVWVGIRRRESEASAASARSQAPDGIATFEHVQVALGRHDDWQVGFGFPLLRAPMVPIERRSLPAEPIELVLPDTGGLTIALVDEHDRPVDGATVSLQITAFDSAAHLRQVPPEGPWSVPRADTAGRARVSHLGLGLHLRITATSRDASSNHRPSSIDVAGPQRAGEVVSCSVPWRSSTDPEAAYPVVAGRFVRLDGRPWPEAELDAWWSVFPTPRQAKAAETMHVGPGGRFELQVREDWPAGGTRILEVQCREPRELAGIRGRLDLSRELPAPMTDVGDVVLDHGPSIASGTTVDQRGDPVAGATIELCQRVPGPDGDLWPTVRCAGRVMSAADGTFELRVIPDQELPRSELRLRAQCESHASAEIGIEPGVRGVRLVLPRNGTLEGSVLLSAGQRPEDIAVVLLREGMGMAAPSLAEDGSFHQDGLAPGPLDLVAYLRSGVDSDRKASRVEIGGLTIVAGERNRDPRIQGISIRGSAVSLTIRVIDHAGNPIARAAVEVLRGRDVLTGADGLARIHPAALPADVRVTAFGYRDVALAGVDADRDVALAPGLRILLRTGAKPQGRDPDYQLGFSLHHVDAQGRRGEPVYRRSFPHERTSFDPSGTAALPVPAPGRYEVVPHVFVLRQNNVGAGGALVLTPSPRITVLEVEELQTFDITIPQSVVDAAVAGLEK